MPFNIEAIRSVAQMLSERGEPVVTDFRDWGPWVNGGAWIETSVCKVDFLYRSLDQIERTVHEAKSGAWQHDFDQQPPFGFRSVTYLAETACAVPLYDPCSEVACLKASIAVYPPALKQRITADTLWGAEFSLLFADDFADKGDVPNTVACLTRVYHYLVQAIFSLNETYFINDKRSTETIHSFARKPEDFTRRTTQTLGQAGADRLMLLASVNEFRSLFRETVSLAGVAYQPKFSISTRH
jgi:hypothetical protein